MVIAIDGKWLWDSWYVHDGERWHGYFLQADRSLGDPDLRHFNVTQGHATSTDLVDWRHLGTTFQPATGPAWDDYTTWTGSVVRGDDGFWHLFYTGTSKAEAGLYQRVGHATSVDLHNWSRVGDGLALDLTGPAADHYEKEHMAGFWHDRAMRDPWVMRDPEGQGWLMYFTARAPGIAEANGGGAIGFATSPDLANWTLQPPVFTGAFGQLEVPQVFERDGRWFCLFCTSSQHWGEAACELLGTPATGSHYLIGTGPRGPWQVAPLPLLDMDEPCQRYAARVVETPEGLRILGFADRGKADFGGFITDPDPVELGPDGLLRVVPSSPARE
ncbi:levansucrase [Rubellimicrobium rubrum]|uniref:Levansucrase n=1 Tax=Rubellimicrobium rubrum TaxID=2585369 RepID=A0A5C4MPR4_9RHOB|nr:levansucrase [Rubellimicrobium rubrum]TNC46923.1 levansucrase [Rubellimicrobium rubrum]